MAELGAIEKTGFLRGGMPGETFATDLGGVPSTKQGAKSLLALPNTPEISVTVEVPKGFFGPASEVKPKYGEPGGGLERSSIAPVPEKILSIKILD